MAQEVTAAAHLGLNDGQSGHGTAAVLVVELGGAFEESRMEVEDLKRR
jgi:hypothetical protein